MASTLPYDRPLTGGASRQGAQPCLVLSLPGSPALWAGTFTIILSSLLSVFTEELEQLHILGLFLVDDLDDPRVEPPLYLAKNTPFLLEGFRESPRLGDERLLAVAG